MKLQNVRAFGTHPGAVCLCHVRNAAHYSALNTEPAVTAPGFTLGRTVVVNQTRNLQSSVSEKLIAAVVVLASHPEEVRIRLRFAAGHLTAAFRAAGALPTDLRIRLEKIQTDLIRFPNPELGTPPDDPDDITALSHSFRNIQKKTGAEIAGRVIHLQRELQYRLDAASGEPLTDPPPATAATPRDLDNGRRTARSSSGDAHPSGRRMSTAFKARRSRPALGKARR